MTAAARKKPQPDAQGATALADRLDALLTSFPTRRHDDPTRWEDCRRDLFNMITGDGGAIRDDWNGARVSLWGITCTCTAGLTGAVRNWINKVRAKTAFDGRDLGPGSVT